MAHGITSMAGMVCISAALLSTTGVCGEEPRGDVHAQLLEELRLLRTTIEALQKEVSGLRAELAAARKPMAAPALKKAEDGHVERGANRERLRAIQLPGEPGPDDIREYVLAIQEASRGQNTFSSTDPQVAMLARVGPENLGLLLESWELGFGGPLYLVEAVSRLAREEHKDLLIRALRGFPELAGVIRVKRWTESAKEVLLEGLRERPQYLPTAWIEAVASLKDPSTYSLLLDFFIDGDNKLFTYRAIKDLPGIELEPAVKTAWERATRGLSTVFDRFERRGLALVAARHGHLEALDKVVETLAVGERWEQDEARKVLRAHTEALGFPAEIEAWYREHRSRLAWDARSRKYMVAD
jgi:hypothetical protein